MKNRLPAVGDGLISRTNELGNEFYVFIIFYIESMDNKRLLGMNVLEIIQNLKWVEFS